ILDAMPDVVDRPEARWVKRARVTGRLTFDDVSFGYDAAHPVLQGVSFDVQAGETVAIVGPSGAGKSTLVSLVPRFYDPDRGRVLLDGMDIRDIQLRCLRSHVSVVLQEAFLFPISIADNIAYGEPSARRERIESAARAANAHDFITELPDGYDTVVGQRGATLSGGQRQRISIARALLKDAPILVLDEATSALDSEVEAEIQETLDEFMAGRTVLAVAHRLSTVRAMDRILVMDEGRIVEQGSHDELLARGGIYARLWEHQSGGMIGVEAAE
ncbi:MAG TPA: ATP-binding cassette domain-containing protein, partial [Paracoccaceae bacterium]|nr:ATP-binding cassette domain-containing protein [Paracoccaceae bacterium]